MHIMWIDDELNVTDTYAELFRLRGHSCSIFTNNDSALKALHSDTHYDLIIQDIIRPAWECLNNTKAYHEPYSGIAFYEQFIRKIRPDIPVVFYSAVAGRDIVSKVNEFENSQLFSKPSLTDDLVEAIEQVHSRKAEKLYDFLERSINKNHIVEVDFTTVNQELLSYLAKYPLKMHDLTPRKFEEMIAHIFADLGYDVVLTPQTRDGGADIYAVRKDSVGDLLYVIECKKYSPKRPVGVGHVRSLYGVKNAERASSAILVTSSFFSEPAKTLQESLRYELSLRNYDSIRQWLQAYYTP